MKTAGVPTDGKGLHKLKLVNALPEADQHDSLEEGGREGSRGGRKEGGKHLRSLNSRCDPTKAPPIVGGSGNSEKKSHDGTHTMENYKTYQPAAIGHKCSPV